MVKISFLIFGVLTLFELLHCKAEKLRIKDFELAPCSGHYYPVTLQKVFIDFGPDGKLVGSGTLKTDYNLTAPLKAVVELKKHIGFWIHVPCENNMGSCMYDDLCAFGYSPDKKCPQRLVENNIPCRCPIAKGVYTLPKVIMHPETSFKSVYTGKYKGTVTLSSHSTLLGCFITSFAIVDAESEYNKLT